MKILKILVCTIIFLLAIQIPSFADTLCGYHGTPVAFSTSSEILKIYPNRPNDFQALVDVGEAYWLESGTKYVLLDYLVRYSYSYVVITSGPLKGIRGYVFDWNRYGTKCPEVID